MADLLLPSVKGGQQQRALELALEMSSFGINFCLRVTLATPLKYGNGGYLARLKFFGQKRQ
jgi:hypothetical protein